MADIMMPILDGNPFAREAIAMMRQHSRSGVIVQESGGFWLYLASEVVIALAEDPSARLSGVKPARQLSPDLSAGTIAFLTEPGLRSRLTGASRSVGNVWFAVDEDLLTSLLAGPRDCYCKVDGKPVPGGTTGSNCPDGHSASVRCV